MPSVLASKLGAVIRAPARRINMRELCSSAPTKYIHKFVIGSVCVCVWRGGGDVCDTQCMCA
jgi:hypothetical protein